MRGHMNVTVAGEQGVGKPQISLDARMMRQTPLSLPEIPVRVIILTFKIPVDLYVPAV